MKKSIATLLSLALIANPNLSKADISSDLKRFFDGAGVSTNASTPGVFKDQSAGYYTGGSIVARNAIQNAQIATLQMPGFRGGCGGIDAWAGGFSHIRSEELVKMLRNVGSSAASYGFMLAVQTVSPQVYNILNELNALATKINSTNINSCEVAATGLGGLGQNRTNQVNIFARQWAQSLELLVIGQLQDKVVVPKGIGKEYSEKREVMFAIRICWLENLILPGRHYKPIAF